MTRILAGDIGGTKTELALYEECPGANPVQISKKVTPSASWDNLEDAVADFLGHQQTSVAAACFGVAGAVKNGVSSLTNLSWKVDTASLQGALGVQSVYVCNDLAAVALALNHLRPSDLVQLNAGTADASGTKATIAAGTGLGQGTLHGGTGNQQIVIPSEGGHAGLAATNRRQLEFLAYCFDNNIESGWETVLSGPGILRIHEFLRLRAGHSRTPSWLADALAAGNDPAAAITDAALSKCDHFCVETLDMFVEYYGNQAGNLALTVMATGGVYIAGGIAPKIQKRLLADNTFINAFARGRQKELLLAMPVHLIVHENPGMLGAATFASANH
jgi:glucokinase